MKVYPAFVDYALHPATQNYFAYKWHFCVYVCNLRSAPLLFFFCKLLRVFQHRFSSHHYSQRVWLWSNLWGKRNDHEIIMTSDKVEVESFNWAFHKRRKRKWKVHWAEASNINISYVQSSIIVIIKKKATKSQTIIHSHAYCLFKSREAQRN